MPAKAADIARRLGASVLAGEGEADKLPAGPGTYGLLLRLREPVILDLARLGNPVLAPGLYLYCGSANGPGGVRARLGRHLRRDKAVRWHIDHLSGMASEIAGLVVAETTECSLRQKASAVLKAQAPVPGFGSSDCRSCPAHLLLLAP
jgi:Uri superfamily endonuclease